MVTRKPVPIAKDPIRPKRTHSATSPAPLSTTPELHRASSSSSGGALQHQNTNATWSFDRDPAPAQNEWTADHHPHRQGYTSTNGMEDLTTFMTTPNELDSINTARKKPDDLTPQSSWESVSGGKSPTELQKNRRESVPSQSNNPFRRARLPSETYPEDAPHTEGRTANLWIEEPRKLPISADPAVPLSVKNFSAPDSIESHQNVLSVAEPEPSADNKPGAQVPQRRPLEELIFGKASGSSVDPTTSNFPSNGSGNGHDRPTAIGAGVPISTAEASVDSKGKTPLDNRTPENTTKVFSPREHKSNPEGTAARDNGSAAPPPVPEKISPEASATPPAPSSQNVSLDRNKSKKANETYQIRLVNWFDASSPVNPRRSPIMVQNANGPCPLLALVNALVLSTPAGIVTALVETLRVREQVSLGLLLDAVIDELMSGRRGDAAQNLPDVGDLYAFLVNLHTGMNVNPCFVVPDENASLMDAPVDMPTTPHLFRRAGGFEETREMRLYSTFAVPLIHGWIPPRTHPAFAALKRRARTYEDAQNLLFREEELEEKLNREGLASDDQQVLEDISSIKYFLSSTATQLTGYGLDTVTETLEPGSLVIFFRNDHFSTLYRHPKSGQLLTLVTDMGYAGHDEVVWESLVDVSGEGSEFYSGDFRPVGNIPSESQHQHRAAAAADPEAGWTTVSNNRTRKGPQQRQSNPQAPSTTEDPLPPLESLSINDQNASKSPNSVQEDHDLALAMQLQEEEEERERQAVAARRREDELSQRYLDNADTQGRRTFPGFSQGAQSAPHVPPRGGSTAQQPSSTRRVVRRESSPEEAPPPSYEQAAKGPAYHPPAEPPHLARVTSSSAPKPLPPQPHRPQRPRGASAYSEQAAVYGGSPSTHGPSRRAPGSRGRGSGLEGSSTGGRRRHDSALSTGGDEERKERDCMVM